MDRNQQGTEIMVEYRTHGLVDGKVRQIIVDENGKTINTNPTRYELNTLEEAPYKNRNNDLKNYTDKYWKRIESMIRAQIIEEKENTKRADIFSRLVATNDRVLAIFHRQDYDTIVKGIKCEYVSTDISIMLLRHALERLFETDIEDIDPCSCVFVRLYYNGSASLLVKDEETEEKREEYIVNEGISSDCIESIYDVVYIYHSMLILKGFDCEHVTMGMYEDKPLSFIADNIVVTIAPRVENKKEEPYLET